MTKHEGGCLCGAVRLTIEGEPIVAGACYCRACQYVSGGGAAYGAMYPAQAVVVTKGELRRFTMTADSGAKVFREFCPTCGVHMISHNSSHPQYRSVKAGVMDDPTGFRSQGNVWTSSAQSWHRIDAELPSWDTEPDFR